jgi:predicted peptidase
VKAHERAFPFFVVFPQAVVQGWSRPRNVARAIGALEQTQSEFKIDAHRVYLTGLSMGGTGTWDLAAAEPGRWAAIVPICGVAKPIDAEKIKDIPCTVFHGARDDVIAVGQSRKMVAALQQSGGHPQYVEFPQLKHACWDQAYATDGLWKWLSEQHRGE